MVCSLCQKYREKLKIDKNNVIVNQIDIQKHGVSDICRLNMNLFILNIIIGPYCRYNMKKPSEFTRSPSCVCFFSYTSTCCMYDMQSYELSCLTEQSQTHAK